MAAPFYHPTYSEQGFQFLHSLASTYYFLLCCVFGSSHANGYEMIYHCGFNSCFPRGCFCGLISHLNIFVDSFVHVIRVVVFVVAVGEL